MAPHGPLRRLSCPVLIGLSLVLSGAAQNAHAGGSTTVPDTKPAWATPANSSGEASDSGTVVFSMWLGWRDKPQLDALLAAQQDPSSVEYHRWLSPQQFRSLFAPDQSSVASVSDWLRAQGFALVDVPQNHLFVTASGTVAQVERAFGARTIDLCNVDDPICDKGDLENEAPHHEYVPGMTDQAATFVAGLV